ncbi:MAG: hypothetical protein EOM53_03680 [Alphaproteobacteria bacterium]|nr:hypothetical protein [Alphaproteobacteria bacterium]NCB49759.1 hypothetical protein [Alphaproteobacteria bacterium]
MGKNDFLDKDKLLDVLTYKIKQKSTQHRNAIFRNTGVLGLYGWYVVLPSLFGLFVGRFLDHLLETSFSWTLNLVLLFSILGFIAATHWTLTEGFKKNKEARKKEQDEIKNALSQKDKTILLKTKFSLTRQKYWKNTSKRRSKK